ncbi:hypothetical protein [Mycobacteroides abscessus]|uniref:hypothetical protein n=1 Tax=Mycobacteroides abscessus TaxID=36809 RepID=UPI00092652FB|nr:hypothetical protein [Mycobacteroides abscessus]SIC59931.1 Uncharacterised protein [Mycobacteroides abscessus subsp. abscessus]
MSQPSVDYSPIEISADAVAFAESKFGQHYLKRLAEAKERYVAAAMRLDLTDNYRAHMMTQAKTVSAEIEYFQTAQAVRDDPKLMERLRIAAQKRSKKQEDV